MIVVNDNSCLLVGQNLFDALFQLRETYPRERVWIDAVCINQEDKGTEKALQLGMMDRIYRNASFVVTWLGTGGSGTTQLLEIFQALDRASPDDFYLNLMSDPAIRDPYDDGRGDETRQIFKYFEFEPLASTFWRLGLPLPDSDLWRVVADFFHRRRWFSRLWVIQEAALARELVALVGCHVVSWRAMIRCFELISHSSVVGSALAQRALLTQGEQDELDADEVDPSELDPDSASGRALESTLDRCTRLQQEAEEKKAEGEDKFDFSTIGTILNLGCWVSLLLGNKTSPFLSGRKWDVDVGSMKVAVLSATGAKHLHWSHILYWLLWTNRGSGVTHPRDSVYGLLGVLKAITDSVGIEPHSIEVNTAEMSKPDEKVVVQSHLVSITEMVVRKSESLHILMTAPPTPVPSRRPPTLPSWVPDLIDSVMLGRGLFEGLAAQSVKFSFTASGEQSPLSEMFRPIFANGENEVRELRVRAFQIGRVRERIMPINPYSGLWKDWSEVARFLDELDSKHLHTREAKLDAFWRTLIFDHTKGKRPAEPLIYYPYAHMISAAVTIHYTMILNDEGEDEADGFMRSLAKCALLSDGIIRQIWHRIGRLPSSSKHEYALVDFAQHQQNATAFLRLLSPIYRYPRKLFATDGGYMGLGPESLEEGDSIWIVAGCPVPLAMRPRIRGGEIRDWELVSPVYVHNIMSGEAVEGASWELVRIS